MAESGTTIASGIFSPVMETLIDAAVTLNAMRADVPLDYDSLNMKFTNYDEANQYLDRPKRRAGWEP